MRYSQCMEISVPPGPPERVFHIAYQEFAGTQYNLDLRGKGTLTVRRGESFAFTGRARGLFGVATTLPFSSAQIWNVSSQGNRIEFATALGKSGSKRKPFVFFAASAAEAAEIAALLPATRDADAVAGQEFLDRLSHLPLPQHAWGSVTNIVIAANVAIFVIMGLLGAGWIDVTDLTLYIRYGANRADATTDGEWWRLVTSMFLHYGIMHLLLNMWALLQVGHLVERLYGRVLYSVVYFGSGIIGSVVTLLWHSKKLVWSAGASGAVFGVYGVLLGYMLRDRQGLPKAVFQPLLKSTLFFAGYNLLYGLVHPAIDNAAHLGGLAGGVVLGWLAALPLEPAARRQLVRPRAAIGTVVVALVVAVGVAASPRFDYRVPEALAFEHVNQGRVAPEKELLKRQQNSISTSAKEQARAQLPRWLTEEAIPFYRQWADDLDALQLAPGRLTVSQRDRLVKILRMKVAAYEHLRAGLEQGDAEALSKFHAEERTIAAAVKEMSRLGQQHRPNQP